MARWEPDARGRLAKAAMELFHDPGYERTTVEAIAARAGLTERTFFRYFADKREVLFSGSQELEKSVVEHIEAAPPGPSPLDVVAAALAAWAAELEAEADPHYVRARYALVNKHADLQERELIKLANLTAAVRKALQARGVPEPSAGLAAEAGIAVFKIGFERWVKERKPKDFAGHIHAALGALRVVTADPPAPRRRRAPPKSSRPVSGPGGGRAS